MFHFLIKRAQRDSTERTQRNTVLTKKNILPVLLSLFLLFTLAFSCVSRTVINRKILAQNIQFASTTPTVLEVGDIGILSVTVEPEEHDEGVVMWKSSDINVISLNLTGSSTATYSADNPGTATITATVGTTSISIDSDPITVGISAESIEFTTPPPLTLEVDDTGALFVTVEPSNHTDGAVVWESSDISVLSLNPSGATTTYSADNPGTVTITATVGTTSISRTITVGIPAISVAIDSASKPADSVNINDTGALTATVLPADHTDGDVQWSSSNTEFVSIDEQTGMYRAVGIGTATITARIGSVSDTTEIQVLARSIPAESIKFASTTPTNLEVSDDIGVLSVTVTPSNHTDGAVVWESDNPSVLSVTSTGPTTAEYSAKSIRTVTITASVGTASITHTFNIFGVDGSIILDFKETPPNTLSPQSSGTIFLVVHPTNHSLGEPKWQALHSDIFTLGVADNGLSAEYQYRGATSGTTATTVTITLGSASISHIFRFNP